MTMQISLGGRKYPAASFAEASNLMLGYCMDYGLGNSDLRRGDGDLTDGKRVVAHVSYNGRVWDGTAREWTNATTCRYNPYLVAHDVASVRVVMKQANADGSDEVAGWEGTLAEFVNDNHEIDGVEKHNIEASIRAGMPYVTGGGAAPIVTLVRAS